MDEVNYNDTVVVPFLEKKCKDLLAVNLVLEAKLLIEQTKVKNSEKFANDESDKFEGLVDQIENLKLQHSREIDSIRNQYAQDLENLRSQLNNTNQNINIIQGEKNTIETDRNNLTNQVSVLQAQIMREQSLKDNAIAEYHNLNDKYTEMHEKLTNIQNENQIFITHIEELKKKISEPKTRKQQQSQVV